MSHELKKQEYEALLELQSRSAGVLVPEAVVAAAADEDSPFHDRFTWDDAAAAHYRRLDEARMLIRTFTVMVKISGSQKPEKLRAFISLSSDRRVGGGYRSLVDVVNDSERYAEMLHDALAELQSFKRKYSMLKELKSVIQELDRVAATYTGQATRQEVRASA